MTLTSVKTILFASLIATIILPFGMDYAFADHPDTDVWNTDREFDIQSSLNSISHASFTPATDFEDAADVWNSVSNSWWDFTRDDSSNDVEIGAWFMGWHISTLAETTWYDHNGSMLWAFVDFNNAKDFRDVNVSQGWWSFDYETVAIHEIGHVAGIHDHTTTTSSPMKASIPSNNVDRTLNSHDKATIRGMY